MKNLTVIILLLALCLFQVADVSAYLISGNFEYEQNLFLNDELYYEQERDNVSYALELEFYQEFSPNYSFTFTPFGRVDSADEVRSHFDIRELNCLYVAEYFELRAGLGKVFWGATEFVHLVDIINQGDYLENIDGEDKLGQQMVHLSVPADWGVLDLFVLPGFRPRAFPGLSGRFRPPVEVIPSQAGYENGAKENHVDYALRYSHTLGDADFGISRFQGTGRDPLLMLDLDDSFEPRLIPYYPQIVQTGIDVQLVAGEWLLKFEGVKRLDKKVEKNRDGDELKKIELNLLDYYLFREEYFSVCGGFEYTFTDLKESGIDLGVIGERVYDERGVDATTPSQNEVMFGVRLALNDAAGSELLAGLSQDIISYASMFSLEASRRFGENLKTSIECRTFSDIPQDDPLYSIRDDGYLRLQLKYYF